VIGGALADSLPWVFVSGYQAAIRCAFPELPASEGWNCFAATEDRDGKLPGSTLHEAGDRVELFGTKTWVAASDHVAQLLVTVGTAEAQRIVVEDRHAEGVTVESYDRASFLDDMSQGRATFEDAAVELELAVPPSGHGFGAAEPLHVLTALNAFMLGHTVALAGPASLVSQTLASIHGVAMLSEHELTVGIIPYGLAGLDAHTETAAEEFEALIEEVDAELHDRWSVDRRLVGMFSSGINRHAEAAAGRENR
jgi:acyl-CoA dehydrogenase